MFVSSVSSDIQRPLVSEREEEAPPVRGEMTVSMASTPPPPSSSGMMMAGFGGLEN